MYFLRDINSDPNVKHSEMDKIKLNCFFLLVLELELYQSTITMNRIHNDVCKGEHYKDEDFDDCKICKKISDKNITVAKLLGATYGKDTFIQCIAYSYGIDIVFKNKPDQRLSLTFTTYDTWDKIKNKMQKLKESDGVCVVCCEVEKGKKKIIREKCCDVPHCKGTFKRVSIADNTFFCNTCCEFICKKCYRNMDGTLCPVCRTCLGIYNRNHEDDCLCVDNDESDDD